MKGDRWAYNRYFGILITGKMKIREVLARNLPEDWGVKRSQPKSSLNPSSDSTIRVHQLARYVEGMHRYLLC
jgi:hypothetical protein